MGMSVVEELGRRARQAALRLSSISTKTKNEALVAMAEGLLASQEAILEANRKDLEAGAEAGISGALMDRLTLNGKRIEDMAAGLREVAALPDPVGEVVDGWRLPNGLDIQKIRVPLGVVGIIYEARPNVTVDAAGLCVKSGNAVILRGSSSAINSNKVLTESYPARQKGRDCRKGPYSSCT